MTARCKSAPRRGSGRAHESSGGQPRDKDVDPVGACVGMKGMRVQSIIRELRGEKIDIIPYSEETVAFVIAEAERVEHVLPIAAGQDECLAVCHLPGHELGRLLHQGLKWTFSIRPMS